MLLIEVLNLHFIMQSGRIMFRVWERDGPLSWSHNEHPTVAAGGRDDRPADFRGTKEGSGNPDQALPQTSQTSP